MYFFKSKAMKKVIEENEVLRLEIKDSELELNQLTKDRRIAVDDLADIKAKRKIEEEDLKHLIRMKEERSELDFEKKEVALRAELQKDKHKISNDYRDKHEQFLNEKAKTMTDMYTELLQRLPDINVKLKGDV